MELFVIGAVIVVLLLILISNIAVVQQSRAYVIERLGAFQTVWGVGLHFKIPFIEKVAKKVSSGRIYHSVDLGILETRSRCVVISEGIGTLRRQPEH